MKQLRIALVISTLLFLILSACSYDAPGKIPPATLTPVVVPPQDVQLKANNPAVVSQDTGPAGLSQSQPQIELCTPPEATIGTVYSFCANQPTKTGGATIAFNYPAMPDANGGCVVDNSSGKSKFVCSGPENTTFNIHTCSRCGPKAPTGSALFGDYSCSKGTALTSEGACNQASPEGDYFPCPAGSHYDNDQQYCLDDATNQKVADLCPPGTVAYLPGHHYCLTKPFPERYNCQTYTITLGACTVRSSHPGCQAPALGCTRGKHWDGASCSCK